MGWGGWGGGVGWGVRGGREREEGNNVFAHCVHLFPIENLRSPERILCESGFVFKKE